MSNKRLWIDELQPGMKLAAPVVYRKRIIVDKDTILTIKIIENLKRQAETLTVLVEEDARQKTLTSWEYAVRQKYEKTVDNVREIFGAVRETKEVPVDKIVELTSVAVNDLLKESYILQSLKLLNSHDEYTFHHSLNVGVLCGVLGKWLKYGKDMLFLLVLSGILHDIGKAQIPLKILNKPEKLTLDEMSIMKKHTTVGFAMLKDIIQIPDEAKLATLQHHEKVDGTGYPFALPENKISDFSKIVAVADTYDAVTSNRVYQKARSPFMVMEIFQEEMFIRLDSKICLPMLTQIKHNLVGRQVITEDGRRAKIVFVGTQSSEDMVIETEDGELIALNIKDYSRFKDYIG